MRTVALVLIAASLSLAVVDTHQQETFAVASIRRDVSGQQQGTGLTAAQPGGRYVARGATLRRLVADAHGPADVIGGPSWADTDRFDIEARADGERTPAESARLLRILLAERFNLAVHAETRVMPIYTLAPARATGAGAPGLRESAVTCAAEAARYLPKAQPGDTPACGDFRLGGRSLVARGMTMPRFAELLSGRVDRPVVDGTTLEGVYDLQIEWSSDVGLRRAPPGAAGGGDLRPDGVSLFTALQEQLGLRLEPTRGPVDVVVIDHAEPPAPN